MHEDQEKSEFIRSIEARQKNVLWPDALHNSSSVDEFLWKGRPNASKVERAGAVIFGLVFICGAVSVASIASHVSFIAAGILFTGLMYVGGRILFNGIVKRKH